MFDELNLADVIKHYDAFVDCPFEQVHISSLGNGLINQTWLVRNELTAETMVLQRLNTQVFEQPWDVIENAQKIGEHLRFCVKKRQYDEKFIKPIPTLNGKNALENAQGFWRAINFFPESTALDKPEDLKQVSQAAGAYGRFSRALMTLDSNTLVEVIANFHHLPARLEQLWEGVGVNYCQRLEKCGYWIDYIKTQSYLTDELHSILPQLPKRIVHNDTKLNNLLFNKVDMTPLAVIDLDTCMPGYLMYDFGDMARAMCASQAEDMQKFDDIHIKLDEFAALSQGYLRALNGVITPQERDSLWLGVKLVTFELAVRFLTDYLKGDIYFHIEHPEHNLERARNQFTLYQSLLSQEQTLRGLIPELTQSK